MLLIDKIYDIDYDDDDDDEMIIDHCSSIVGTGISQFRSKTLRFTLPFFARFRNSEDRFVNVEAIASSRPLRDLKFLSPD